MVNLIPTKHPSTFFRSIFTHVMYPDWPRSGKDLVPLPLCDGPKLKAFDFQGPQNIEFLEYIGE